LSPCQLIRLTHQSPNCIYIVSIDIVHDVRNQLLNTFSLCQRR